VLPLAYTYGNSGISWSICKSFAFANYYRPDALHDAQLTVSKH